MLSCFVREVGQSFRRNEGGNVAMMKAIALVFIVGAVAVSLDMSKGVSNKSRLSDTTDAMALFLAKSGFETQVDLQRAATEYMAKSYPGEDGNFLKILSISKDGDAVTVKMADVSENSFGGIVDAEGEYVSVSATAVWSQRTMDMVLVLDTTLSMEGTRLTSLKRAATDMVNTIDKPGSDNFRISVVPFSEYVNVGLSRRYERWMAVPNDTSTTSNVCRKKRDVTSKSNCRTIRGTRDRDGVTVPHTYQKCDRTYGPEYEVCGPRTVSKKWYGCVGSRSEPYDLRADFQGRKIPGLLNERCGAEILEMTSSFAAARSTISNLSARGNTYMPSGLM
jgi:Flp pilus assembly protein TadG